MKIGFFDSGLGGLTVLKAVAAQLPNYDYEYFGDTKNVPYGDRSEEEIYELTKAGVRELFSRDCALVVIACNTASAETLRRLQDIFLPEEFPDRRILGVIIPTIETVIDSEIEHILLIATRRTIASEKYEREFAKFEQAPILETAATPGLVPLIEAGETGEALSLVFPVIDQFVSDDAQRGLILGCTHYTTLQAGIKERYGEHLVIFSQNEIIPAKLEAYLAAHPEIESTLTRNATRNIFFTKQDAHYDQVIGVLLGGAFVRD